ncbi:unnamed protein product [Adineta steineri]|uniref:Uncharacterized protein n=1 Tax=Adineta steineri TaxID=433720 RepID=A0A818PS19_9BILA|nr:unnamed protein product [Adineta steineri]CAF3623814.1 unnamed protein product [Adineta steineri]
MVSRFFSCVSSTVWFFTIAILTITGLTAIVIGLVGLGLYIPISMNYYEYTKSTCSIISHKYEDCQHGNTISLNTCFSVMWSVEYILQNSIPDRYIFSTITEIYTDSTVALEELRNYPVHTNHTCYYRTTNTANVQWLEPLSPIPYLVMLVVGFSLTGVYCIVISIIVLCRRRKQ